MLKRIWIYLKEMYPVGSRLAVSAGLVFGIYGLVVLTLDIKAVTWGVPELVAVITVFGFLMGIRIADEFKDLSTDMINYPKRPLPSGRVKEQDLVVLLAADLFVVILLNTIYMNNLVYLAALLAYGTLMSLWFFAKKWIQPNLLLALVTHNPVQLLLAFYVISFVCIKYVQPVFSPATWLIALAFYFPGLAWEVSRKIKAPKKENQYTTYSKVLGYKRAVYLVLWVLAAQLVVLLVLVRPLSLVMSVLAVLAYAAVLAASIMYIRKPSRFVYGKAVQAHIYAVQTALIAMEAVLLHGRRG